MYPKKENKAAHPQNNLQDSSRYAEMLISREKGRFKTIDAVKVSQGSFYTEANIWLTSPVRRFIEQRIIGDEKGFQPCDLLENYR